MERFVIDRGHPFTFTAEGLKKRFKMLSWEVEREEHSGYLY
jgi:hypothetical protein